MEDVRCFVCSVLKCSAVLLCDDMDVGSTTGVVTGEDSQPLSDSVLISLLYTTEVIRVLRSKVEDQNNRGIRGYVTYDIRCIRAITITTSSNTGVNTSCVRYTRGQRRPKTRLFGGSRTYHARNQ